MAHLGQEVALRAAGSAGGGMSTFELLPQFAIGSDVPHEAESVRRFAGFVADDFTDAAEPADVAFGTDDAEVAVEVGLPGGRLLPLLLQVGDIFRMHVAEENFRRSDDT